MLEQKKANNARLIGYALGLVAVATTLAWKFLVR